MSNVYLALNGDDVGSRIGDAIANDDHEGLASASSSIEGAHGDIDAWIESVGGKKITRSGDEGIYIVPEDALDQIEEMRGQYKESSGHGLTVGVGQSMSEASKALIYGKLNGKDQVVHYEPMIEDYLADEGVDEDQIPDEQEVQQDADQDMEDAAGATNPDDQQDEEEQATPPPSKKPAPMGSPVDNQQGEEQDEQADESQEAGDPMQEEALEEEGTEDDPEIGNEDDIAADSDEALDSPAPPVQHKSKHQVQQDPKEVDGKVGDKDFGDGDGEISADEDAIAHGKEASDIDETDTPSDDDDSNPEAEQMAASDGKVKGDSVYQDLGDEGAAGGNEGKYDDQDAEMGQEQPQEEQPQEGEDQDQLASMIHGDMESDDQEQPQEEGEEQPQEDSALDDELKQDIASALIAFKENKEMLEQAREQNPPLYQATVTMLTSMIAMAKKLGYAPEQDVQDQVADQELQEGFPGAEETEEQPEEGEEQGEQDQSEPPPKMASPQGPPGKK